MKSEIMKKWVAALESGKYKQGHRQLRTKDEYCCLGVLCEIAKKEGVIEDYHFHAPGLPSVVQDWAGMYSSHGETNDADFCLTRLNDGTERILKQIETKKGDISVRYGRKMSFKNIAKVIREYYANL